MIWWMVLLACSKPPVIESAEPTVLQPGDEVQVTGQHLNEEMVGIQMGPVAGEWVPLSLESITETSARFIVPEQVPAGRWTLRPSVGTKPEEPSQTTLEVWTAATEPACDKRFILHSEVALDPARLDVIWQFKDRDPVRHVIEATDIVGFVHEKTPECEAVWAKTQDGQKWLVLDGKNKDLSRLGSTMAATLRVPWSGAQ